jgi:hypothetical protein
LQYNHCNTKSNNTYFLYHNDKFAFTSAELRECFPTSVLLGDVTNPLRPTESCESRDISERGSSSDIFACLCTTNFCNSRNGSVGSIPSGVQSQTKPQKIDNSSRRPQPVSSPQRTPPPPRSQQNNRIQPQQREPEAKPLIRTTQRPKGKIMDLVCFCNRPTACCWPKVLKATFDPTPRTLLKLVSK